MMQLLCWVTPAGTRDEGGKVQPAYLNFALALLATPAHGVMEVRLSSTCLHQHLSALRAWAVPDFPLLLQDSIALGPW